MRQREWLVSWLIFASMLPAQAQDCPPWMLCYPQAPQLRPARPELPEPPRVKSSMRKNERILHKRHREQTWRDMSQEHGRNWIREQAHAFCRRYPKDEVCQQPAETETKR